MFGFLCLDLPTSRRNKNRRGPISKAEFNYRTLNGVLLQFPSSFWPEPPYSRSGHRQKKIFISKVGDYVCKSRWARVAPKEMPRLVTSHVCRQFTILERGVGTRHAMASEFHAGHLGTAHTLCA